MLKTTKAEKARYPKPCVWCGQDVKYGPFTYGKVKDTDTQSVMAHGSLDDPESCAYKFARGQQALPTDTPGTETTHANTPRGRCVGAPEPGSQVGKNAPSVPVEGQRIRIRDPDPASSDYLILEPAQLESLIERVAILEASIANMIHLLDMSVTVGNKHPANTKPWRLNDMTRTEPPHPANEVE